MRNPRLSFLSEVIRKDRIPASLSGDLLAEALLYQPRHVVYHSHYPRIFNSHGANHAESADTFVGSDAVGCGDKSTIAHRAREVFAADRHVHVARVISGVVDTFVQYLDQARLLFKHPEQVAHAFDVVKI